MSPLQCYIDHSRQKIGSSASTSRRSGSFDPSKAADNNGIIWYTLSTKGEIMARLLGALAAAVFFLTASAIAQDIPAAPQQEATTVDAATAEEQARAQAQAFFDSLHRQTGVIAVAQGKVTLNVPETHYFLGPEDARRVIVELWGNPPETGNVEGMIFPRDGNPAAGSWGAVVEYSADGYVSDSDANSTDYDQLLRDMQQEAESASESRRQNGFPTVTLVGWAERPHYDAATHKIYWGRQLRFGGEDGDTLNYDIRILGREGYLMVSFISSMNELDSIRRSTPAVLSMAEFTSGNRYADFREGVDQRAAYGIGGLVAGGALAAVAQKTGLLAILLAFGKKFVVLIGVAIAGLVGAIRKFFSGRSRNDDPPSST
jgi:uncharacterized membrane-anchored protein